jgi:hypothetical protein
MLLLFLKDSIKEFGMLELRTSRSMWNFSTSFLYY